MDIAETLEDNPDEMREIFAEEIQYVEDFLQKLRTWEPTPNMCNWSMTCPGHLNRGTMW